jgi:hypothetical protein
MLRPFLAAAVVGFAGSSFSDDAPDKSHYNLLNPTPRSFMREMDTDRPDKTETPFTVDAGHFQIESDLVAFEHDHDTSHGANATSDAWSFVTLNLKAGLCNFSDFQLVLAPYSRIRSRDRIAAQTSTQSGFGDVLTRIKINLWGNDSGSSALAVMPFAKWPTSQDKLGNNAIEGGIIFPWAVELPAGFGLGGMTEFDWLEDSTATSYHPEFVNTITLSHVVIGKLGGFIELATEVSAESNTPWIGTFDFGFAYAFTPDLRLDVGAYIGVTKSAPDIAPFIGMSVRF